MKIAVMGATGYTGRVLMRLLLTHPFVDQILPVSASAAGAMVNTLDPGLGTQSSGKLPEDGQFLSREEALAAQPDAVFSALPPGDSADFCEPFFGKSVLLDLSADFRLWDSGDHKSAYGRTAPFPSWRKQAVYGLAEIYRDQIAAADIIAVPGCYPTCVLLPLIPLAKASLLTGPITVNAMSGISGAGRKPKETAMFVERSESVTAYNPGLTHRHVPEMRQSLLSAGCHAPLYFTPHLVPIRRGMEATTSVSIDESPRMEECVARALKAVYEESSFVQLRDNQLPDTRDVAGSNRCDIGWRIVEGGMLYLFSVIDNLLKGSAGQAVQDFNIRFGFPETAGLPSRGDV